MSLNNGSKMDRDFTSGIELSDDTARGVRFCKAPSSPGTACDAAKCSTRACVLAVTDLAPGQKDWLSSVETSSPAEMSVRPEMLSRDDILPDESHNSF